MCSSDLFLFVFFLCLYFCFCLFNVFLGVIFEGPIYLGVVLGRERGWVGKGVGSGWPPNNKKKNKVKQRMTRYRKIKAKIPVTT